MLCLPPAPVLCLVSLELLSILSCLLAMNLIRIPQMIKQSDYNYYLTSTGSVQRRS